MKKHLLQAAKRGDADAQFNLGIMYENALDDSRYAIEGERPEGAPLAAGRRRTGPCPVRRSS
jgi:TPR repeat protein